jgi:hypothetical protein
MGGLRLEIYQRFMNIIDVLFGLAVFSRGVKSKMK